MRVTMAAAVAALWMAGAGQALAQTAPAAGAAPGATAETRDLLDAARATAPATRDTADSVRVLPDQLHQILTKLDKLEDKLDKIENAVKAQNGRRGR